MHIQDLLLNKENAMLTSDILIIIIFQNNIIISILITWYLVVYINNDFVKSNTIYFEK